MYWCSDISLSTYYDQSLLKIETTYEFLSTGTPRYMQVRKMRFHFNAIDYIRPISINSARLNANCLLDDQVTGRRKSRFCVGLRRKMRRKKGKLCSIYAISPPATFLWKAPMA
jgi:hypothetical protein